LRLKNNKMGKLKKIEYLETTHDVYDIEVEDNHNFYANDILAHNCEIALRPYQFCNLCEVNASDINSQEEFNNRASAAAFIGTLQASYTDFHYLRDIWKKTTEKDALLGIGMTGIGSGEVLKYNMSEAAEIAAEMNKVMAKLLGINPAARVTCVKPSGTTSCVLGTSSGIHAWHAEYYVRRIRVGKNEALYTYLSIHHPELLEDDYFRPEQQAVISIPIKAPKDAILRTESALDLLERVKKVATEWVKPGHGNGSNSHNVSATVSLKDDEWETVGEWMWKNRKSYNGLSVLPHDGGQYKQAPFENITEERYNELYAQLKGIDFTQIVEMDDITDLKQEAACAGGACEV
jgi:ribonucleoside-triphosphate reductase